MTGFLCCGRRKPEVVHDLADLGELKDPHADESSKEDGEEEETHDGEKITPSSGDNPLQSRLNAYAATSSNPDEGEVVDSIEEPSPSDPLQCK